MILTQRLLLRITDQSDLNDLQACLNRTEISDAIYFIPHPFSLGDAQKWIDRSRNGLAQETEWLFSVFLNGTQTYIGSINIHQEGEGICEVGYWLHPDHWGKGYATEILSAALTYAFETLNMDSVFSTTAIDNIGSQRVLEKLGFAQTKQVESKEGDVVRPSLYFERNRG